MRLKIQTEPPLKLLRHQHARISFPKIAHLNDGAALENRERAEHNLLEAEPVNVGQEKAVPEIHPAVMCIRLSDQLVEAVLVYAEGVAAAHPSREVTG